MPEPTQDPNPPSQPPGPPKEIESTLAKERMVKIIKLNGQAADDGKMILDLLNERPELDAVFCRIFGIRPETPPGMPIPDGRR